jgi:hypothetical protein
MSSTESDAKRDVIPREPATEGLTQPASNSRGAGPSLALGMTISHS